MPFHWTGAWGRRETEFHRSMNRMMMKTILPIIVLFLLLSSCGNEPPLYQMRAKEYLRSKGVSEDLIIRLSNREDISASEAERLSAYPNVPVLHLLASNPSTPEKILLKLIDHSSFEVHTGLVSNPSTPIDIVLKFRTKGEYTTVNDYISRNPNLPAEILIEMYNLGEIGKTGPALNPNCPKILLWRIFNEGTPADHAWLATNPNLPKELINKLENSGDSVVQQHLLTNPKYKSQKRPEKTQTIEQTN